MQVQKIGTNIGARIEGLDFAAGLDDAMIDAIAEFLCQVILKGCGLRD